ncbi:alpha/beta fold hydrolase [Photobacterium ganghwense]|uniref:alpha/beta fold hydrolase n=1 Tax=Photobacterium ganghwense TaxID=320778 RepID=UPI0039EECBDC
MMNKTGHYLTVNGADIYYELSGNRDGKPLLVLHGGLGSIDDLQPLWAYIPADAFVIAVDFRGHGRSTLGDAPLSYAQYQQDIEAVLEHLQVNQYAIFGFSDGGIVGYRLAAAHPDKVERLVTLGSQWRLEPDDPAIRVLQSLSADFWAQRFPEDVARYQAINPTPDFSRLVDAVKDVWLDVSHTGYPNQTVEAIQCPVLIMRGDNDFLFALQEAVLLKARLPEAEFANLPFTSHACHHEDPQTVGNIVNRFLLNTDCS